MLKCFCEEPLPLDSEDICATKCGHIFHHSCLLQWMEINRVCPQCRTRVTSHSKFRIYPTISDETAEVGNIVNEAPRGFEHTNSEPIPMEEFWKMIEEHEKEIKIIKDQNILDKLELETAQRRITDLEQHLEGANKKLVKINTENLSLIYRLENFARAVEIIANSRDIEDISKTVVYSHSEVMALLKLNKLKHSTKLELEYAQRRIADLEQHLEGAIKKNDQLNREKCSLLLRMEKFTRAVEACAKSRDSEVISKIFVNSHSEFMALKCVQNLKNEDVTTLRNVNEILTKEIVKLNQVIKNGREKEVAQALSLANLREENEHLKYANEELTSLIETEQKLIQRCNGNKVNTTDRQLNNDASTSEETGEYLSNEILITKSMLISSETVNAKPETVMSEIVTAMPETVITESETVTAMPETVITESETVTSMPETVIAESETVTAMPETVIAEPETVTAMPETVIAESETVTAMPETVIAESEQCPLCQKQ